MVLGVTVYCRMEFPAIRLTRMPTGSAFRAFSICSWSECASVSRLPSRAVLIPDVAKFKTLRPSISLMGCGMLGMFVGMMPPFDGVMIPRLNRFASFVASRAGHICPLPPKSFQRKTFGIQPNTKRIAASLFERRLRQGERVGPFLQLASDRRILDNVQDSSPVCSFHAWPVIHRFGKLYRLPWRHWK